MNPLRPNLRLVIVFFCLSLLSCGNETTTTALSDGEIVFIYSSEFVPNPVQADAGQTIFFINEDSTAHQIVSQSAEDAFDDSGDFDSGIIPTGVTGSITVPSTATSGDVFYFYDAILEDQFQSANGSIEVN